MWDKYLDCWLDFSFFQVQLIFFYVSISLLNDNSFFLKCYFPGSGLYLLYTQSFFPFPYKVFMTWPTKIVSILCFLPICCIQTLQIQIASCHPTSQCQISAVALGLTPSLSYHCILQLYFLACCNAYMYFTFLLFWKFINK